MRRQNFLNFLFLLLLIAEVAAQTPRIVSIRAKPNADSLSVFVQLADMFHPKIVNTIRSGLPAVIRFDFRVLETPDREIQQALRSLRIVYDLWSDRYQLRGDRREQFVPNFAELEKICHQFEEPHLLSLARLPAHKNYQLRLQVAVIPISAKQDQQLRDWLAGSENTAESAPGEDRSAEFRLNLNKLFSFFWGKKERPFGASEWAISPPFRVE
jgi:hypothetical protein